VVLLKASIKKRWVAEELDAAVVKRIQDNTRPIPVVLNGLEPIDLPVAIRHLLFEPVTDLDNFEDVVSAAARSVFGQIEKPELGPTPSYATSTYKPIPGRDRIDSLLLKAMGDEAVGDFGDRFRTIDFQSGIEEKVGISEQQAVESLEVLVAYVSKPAAVKPNCDIDCRPEPIVRTMSMYPSASTTFFRDYERMKQTVISRLAGRPQAVPLQAFCIVFGSLFKVLGGAQSESHRVSESDSKQPGS
jgi:hypothetical protein